MEKLAIVKAMALLANKNGKNMKKTNALILVVITTILFSGKTFAVEAAAENSEPHIDIPVKIQKANVVFNMDHLAFSGDQPIGLKYMKMLKERYEREKIKGQIIGVFHSDAGFMTLTDEAYNAYRNIQTGNPYKAQILALIDKGVQIEECAVTMKAKKWTNKDLLPGVKVNAGAVIRLIQLHQEGYYELQP
jgi:intracellular sulfur oxidation DsrE/DsrF family protein